MTSETIAEQLLDPVWRGMPAAYKSRYALTIWQQFESNIRSAAYKSSLARFYTALTDRLQSDPLKESISGISEILQSGEDAAVLRMLRDETTALVLLVRLKNEERKEKRKEEKQNGDIRVPGADDRSLFDQP